MNEYIFNKTLLFVMLFSVTGIFTNITEHYINNASQFLAIFIVVAADMLFGIIRSFKFNKFETKKSFKGIYRLVGFWTLLAVVLAIEASFSFTDWVSEAIMVPILIFQLLSILKNMEQIGILPKSILTDIIAKLDKYKDNENSTKIVEENTEELN